MDATHRLWSVLTLTGFLATLAVLLERPLLLAGSALIGGWVLAVQYSFVSALDRAARSVAVTQAPAQSSVRTGASMPVTLSVALDEPTALHLEITAGLPPVSYATPLRATVSPGERDVEERTPVAWPVAGRHRFSVTRLLASDGRFVASLSTGSRPTVTVEPSGPRRIHVGDGGTRRVAASNEHHPVRNGSGTELGGIREYVPGDPSNRIDWNVTARLGTPHVRERAATADRQTLLVVDHRSTLSVGPTNETKLDYLRDVMLATARDAYERNHPVGLLCVGDGGTTSYVPPATTDESFSRIRDELLDIEPTAAVDRTRDRSDGDAVGALDEPPSRQAIRRAGSDLESDSDPFASTLKPFFTSTRSYERRIRQQPLFNSVRTTLTTDATAVRIVVFTDDSTPTELRETLTIARHDGATVTAFLAPTALYGPRKGVGIEEQRRRYLEFEALRRELAAMDRVYAFEVGPEDRLATVLDADRLGDDRR